MQSLNYQLNKYVVTWISKFNTKPGQERLTKISETDLNKMDLVNMRFEQKNPLYNGRIEIMARARS